MSSKSKPTSVSKMANVMYESHAAIYAEMNLIKKDEDHMDLPMATSN